MKSRVVSLSSDVRVRVTVGAAIVVDNEVLLIKRAAHEHLAGTWELPSGKLEEGETHAEALAREVYEEVGVIMTYQLLALPNGTYHSKSGRLTTQYNYLIEVDSTELTLSEEHDEFTWLPLRELETSDIVDDWTRDILRSLT